MQGTIKQVYQIDRANNKPGAVVFDDHQRFGTFDAAVIKAATGNEGQLAEYTTETKGQYTNLKTLRIVGGAAAPAASGGGLGVPNTALVDATKDVAAAVRELTAAIKARAATPTPAFIGVQSTAAYPAPVAAPVADPAAAHEAALGKELGDDAAGAMFKALRKRYGKNPDKLIEEANELLAANGVSLEAA